MSRTGAHRGRRWGAVFGGCLALVAMVAVSGCADGSAAAPEPNAAARPMKFDLQSDHAGPLAVNVPSAPVTTVHTSTKDLDFELYAAQRSGKVVDIVFALRNTGQDTIGLGDPTTELDENPAITAHFASAIALVDDKGLKEYKTFRENGDEGACLCSETWSAVGGGDLPAGKRRYYAAVVAAPPADVSTVTLKAGITDINDVRIK